MSQSPRQSTATNVGLDLSDASPPSRPPKGSNADQRRLANDKVCRRDHESSRSFRATLNFFTTRYTEYGHGPGVSALHCYILFFLYQRPGSGFLGFLRMGRRIHLLQSTKTTLQNSRLGNTSLWAWRVGVARNRSVIRNMCQVYRPQVLRTVFSIHIVIQICTASS